MPDPIVCDYCDQPATRVEDNGTTPLCPRCARDHYGTDWRTDTRTLGVRARKTIAAQTNETCRWFALCENKATGTLPHPILGDVPVCDRCRAKNERRSQ